MASPSVTALSFSPDASLLAWLSNNSKLRVWNGHRVSDPISIPSARLLSFGKKCIAISDEKHPLVRFVSTDSLNVISKTPILKKKDIGSIISLTPPQYEGQLDSKTSFLGLFATISSSSITVISYTADIVAFIQTPAPISSASFSPDLTRLATGTTRGVVQVWDLRADTQTCIATLNNAHNSFISNLSFSPFGNHLATASWDGFVCYWNISKSQKNPTVRFRPDGGRNHKMHAVALPGINGEEGVIATAGAAAVVKVWRTNVDDSLTNDRYKPQQIADHQSHSASVYVLAFSSNGRYVASGSGDGTVRMLGVPTKPLLVSNNVPDVSTTDTTELIPKDILVQGQLADRQLIFCPSTVLSLDCPICANPYDSVKRHPICSGICGHTYACKICNERLWTADKSPQCPICRSDMVDVAPNYELLRLLEHAKSAEAEAAKSSASTMIASTPSQAISSGNLESNEVIASNRLSWSAFPEMIYVKLYNCTIYCGNMDGEAVGVRVAQFVHNLDSEKDVQASLVNLETERHIRRVRILRGPHIAQYYGVYRKFIGDHQWLVISELPEGGCLSNNLDMLREKGIFLSSQGVLSLALQLIRSIRFLHESNISAGHALHLNNFGLRTPVTVDWSVRHRIKFLDLGGTISKSECEPGRQRSFPSDYIPYLAPEMLDEDPTAVRTATDVFNRACRADMYSLGIVLWELVTGKKPFEGKRPAQIVAAVIGRNERPGYPPMWIPVELQQLISMLWEENPSSRPSPHQACNVLETVPSAPPMEIT